ncbi:MAG TPA: ABC transporter permease, partial [Acidobacteriaceae bacterium]|nr:ABC transporter permease [Acidobacteriaceae bacterium]
MKRFRAWAMRLAGMFHTEQRERELTAEMESHLQMHMEDNLRSGMTPEQARREAILKLGGVEQTKQATRERSTIPFLESLLRDLRFAIRQLRKSPGFTITAILTLALGIAAATTMFAIVDGVLLRPLIFPHAGQLYTPIEIGAKGDRSAWIPYADIQQWQRATHDSAQIAFYGGRIEIAESSSGARLISNDKISTNLLQTLGVQPTLGRDFLPQEQLDGQSHVALLSYSVWLQVFAGNRQALGQTVRIGGIPYNIIGIMPPQFAMPLQGDLPQIFTPIERSTLLKADVHTQYMPIIRLKPGVTPATLQAELTSVQAHIAQAAKPGDEVATHVQLTGLRDSMVANVRPALTALEIAVGLVWLIACFNVAGLLL